jgi:hypothetical protein
MGGAQGRIWTLESLSQGLTEVFLEERLGVRGRVKKQQLWAGWGQKSGSD